jgi:hypothetical protein
MSTVRAKFKCTEISQTEYGERIKLTPVTGGSPENDQFFKWTPGGQIEIGTINPEAAKQFEVGKSFYVDFTLAE